LLGDLARQRASSALLAKQLNAPCGAADCGACELVVVGRPHALLVAAERKQSNGRGAAALIGRFAGVLCGLGSALRAVAWRAVVVAEAGRAARGAAMTVAVAGEVSVAAEVVCSAPRSSPAVLPQPRAPAQSAHVTSVRPIARVGRRPPRRGRAGRARSVSCEEGGALPAAFLDEMDTAICVRSSS